MCNTLNCTHTEHNISSLFQSFQLWFFKCFLCLCPSSKWFCVKSFQINLPEIYARIQVLKREGSRFESHLRTFPHGLFLIHRPVRKARVFFYIWIYHFCILSPNPYVFFLNFLPLSLCVHFYKEHKEDTECSYPVSLLKYEPKGIKTNFIFFQFWSSPGL